MTVLSIKNIEKHDKDTILFPAFNLTVAAQEIIAIYSNLNVRKTLLEMCIGETSTQGGIIQVKGYDLSNKQLYFSQMGISFFEEGLYERLTVADNFNFYKGLYQSNQTIDQILQLTQLEEKRHVKARKLSQSAQKRVLFAKLLFQNPALYIFEEPDLNVDVETKRVFLNLTQKLREKGKSIVVLTSNMESAITVADRVYHLDEKGLQLIEMAEEEKVSTENDVQTVQFNKIPTKVNDKIILFDPQEIDYIESSGGQSNIYIKGEYFPSVFTLNDLEKRLEPYGFFRCHRSYIVNLQKVREVITWTRNSYSLILDDKAKSSVPLSKTKMAQLKGMLGLK